MDNKRNERFNRNFSEEFKKQKVKDLEGSLTTISDLRREFGVSATTIYRWIYKYSTSMKKQVKKVVQLESEQERRKQLEVRVAELERAVGQKQLKIEVLEKMIEIGKTELGIDLKKKLSTGSLSGSEPTKTNTAGK